MPLHRLYRLIGGLCLSVCASLVQAETLRIATLEWSPYVGADLPGQGLAARILHEALALEGMQAELVFLPWQRALNDASAGRYDALMPAYLSTERAALFHTSMPLLDSQLGFFRRRDQAIAFTDLDSLRPYRIGVVRGYVNREDFDRADYLHKEVVTHDWQNLEKLLRGRLDLAVVDRYTGYHLLARHAPALRERLEFIEQPLAVKPLYVLVPRSRLDGQQLNARIDRSLRTLHRSGRIEQMVAQARLEQASAIRAFAGQHFGAR